MVSETHKLCSVADDKVCVLNQFPIIDEIRVAFQIQMGDVTCNLTSKREHSKREKIVIDVSTMVKLRKSNYSI